MYPLLHYIINIIWRISEKKNILLFSLLSKFLILNVYFILFLPLYIIHKTYTLFKKKPTDTYFDLNESTYDHNSFEDKF